MANGIHQIHQQVIKTVYAVNQLIGCLGQFLFCARRIARRGNTPIQRQHRPFARSERRSNSTVALFHIHKQLVLRRNIAGFGIVKQRTQLHRCNRIGRMVCNHPAGCGNACLVGLDSLRYLLHFVLFLFFGHGHRLHMLRMSLSSKSGSAVDCHSIGAQLLVAPAHTICNASGPSS